MRAGCPRTDGRSRPPAAFTLFQVLPALRGSGPVSALPCWLVTKRPQGICSPPALAAGEGAHCTPLPPRCELCQMRPAAPWVLQVPPHSANQQLLQPAGRLGRAGRAGERCQAGRGAPAVPVGLGGAVGARRLQGPSLSSSLPAGSGELVGTPPGQLCPAVPGFARLGA